MAQGKTIIRCPHCRHGVPISELSKALEEGCAGGIADGRTSSIFYFDDGSRVIVLDPEDRHASPGT